MTPILLSSLKLSVVIIAGYRHADYPQRNYLFSASSKIVDAFFAGDVFSGALGCNSICHFITSCAQFRDSGFCSGYLCRRATITQKTDGARFWWICVKPGSNGFHIGYYYRSGLGDRFRTSFSRDSRLAPAAVATVIAKSFPVCSHGGEHTIAIYDSFEIWMSVIKRLVGVRSQ